MKRARRDPLAEVSWILQEFGLGRGLRVRDIRRHYPAKRVRRVAVLEALRKLEDLGAITWNGQRVRWVGPLDPDARPFGLDLRKMAKDLEETPQERVARWIRMRKAAKAEDT